MYRGMGKSYRIIQEMYNYPLRIRELVSLFSGKHYEHIYVGRKIYVFKVPHKSAVDKSYNLWAFFTEEEAIGYQH